MGHASTKMRRPNHRKMLTTFLLTLLLTVVIVIMPASTVSAAQDCSIKITLVDYTPQTGSSMPTFNLYKVGTVNDLTNEPVFDPVYKIAAIPGNVDDFIAARDRISAAARPAVYLSQAASPAGELKVTVEEGIYYIEASGVSHDEIVPMLVWLPYTNERDNSLSYSIDIQPKGETAQSEEPTTVPGKDKDNTKNVQTGDQTNLYLVIGLFVISSIVLLLVFRRRADGEGKDNVK